MAWSPYPNSIMNLDFEINNRLRYSHDPDLRLSELSTREDSPPAILRYKGHRWLFGPRSISRMCYCRARRPCSVLVGIERLRPTARVEPRALRQ